MAETILVVDDEDNIRHTLRGVLADEGFEVLEATDGRRALELLEHPAPRLAIVDIWMPEVDGIEPGQRQWTDDSRQIDLLIAELESDERMYRRVTRGEPGAIAGEAHLGQPQPEVVRTGLARDARVPGRLHGGHRHVVHHVVRGFAGPPVLDDVEHRHGSQGSLRVRRR